MEASLPISFQMILHGGNSRSHSMEALQFAKSGEIEQAKKSLQKAKEELTLAHRIQTNLIQNEAGGNNTEISLILIHAQDHLMNAITVKDLAEEFIYLYKELKEMKER
ncbi:PTS cellobiose transporter subunit IIA [Peribacillus simplex]|uniref:PTS cellobiose transporter subunit IIA n=2 Tax=Bacillaceae TaxID=186817 RepID=A0A120GNX3_9BACI|nr:PTS cellobiose transporter subunit IIA [Peribacillus simplex]